MWTSVLIFSLASASAVPIDETLVFSLNATGDLLDFDELTPKMALLQDRSTTDCGCGNSIGNTAAGRIVGGQEVNPRHKLPYQMFVQMCWNTGGCAMCGGTLINRRYVITAMHCVADDKGKLADTVTVAIGEHDIKKDIENHKAQSITAEKIIVRKDYDSNGMNNDIAILRLSKDVTFNPNVVPACLPTNKAQTFAGLDAVVSGWGSVAQGGKISPVLKETNLKILKQTDAECAFFGTSGSLSNTKMCAYKEGTDSCQGDSGGPLVIKQNGKNTLVGVVSYGAGCAMKGMAGVYVRVTTFLDWINENVKDGWCGGSATITTAATTTTVAAGGCADKETDCADLAKQGWCTNADLKEWMGESCTKTCKKC